MLGNVITGVCQTPPTPLPVVTALHTVVVLGMMVMQMMKKYNFWQEYAVPQRCSKMLHHHVRCWHSSAQCRRERVGDFEDCGRWVSWLASGHRHSTTTLLLCVLLLYYNYFILATDSGHSTTFYNFAFYYWPLYWHYWCLASSASITISLIYHLLLHPSIYTGYNQQCWFSTLWSLFIAQCSKMKKR